ncbi:MAG TPA: ATP-binding cassette domain-containing protein, partial [Brevibacterium sp.]|nr:ATP-binding cassette domain-containing protein [Brevibacterium sp.]
MPEPPQTLRFPDLSVRPGATLVSAADITVDGRLPEPVSLEVLGRTRQLVTGPNGAGKSTLLSVLAGDLCPTTGRVRRSAGTRIAHLRQESALPLDRRASELFASHQDALIATGVFPSSQAVGLASLGLLRSTELGRRIGELSMGQRRRLDLALALSARPHLLLLDEPTNHLSISLVDELTEALRATSAAVVASTHDRQLLRDLSDWPRLGLTSESRARGELRDRRPSALRADGDDHLAEVSAGEQVVEVLGSPLQTGADVLAVADLALLEPAAH